MTTGRAKAHHTDRRRYWLEVSYGNQHQQQAPQSPGPLDGLALLAFAHSVPAPGQGAGSVEYRHRSGALLLPARRRPRAGLLAPLPPPQPAQTPAGMVSGG